MQVRTISRFIDKRQVRNRNLFLLRNLSSTITRASGTAKVEFKYIESIWLSIYTKRTYISSFTPKQYGLYWGNLLRFCVFFYCGTIEYQQVLMYIIVIEDMIVIHSISSGLSIQYLDSIYHFVYVLEISLVGTKLIRP